MRRLGNIFLTLVEMYVIFTSVACTGKDDLFLNSLKMEVEYLEPVEVYEFEDFDRFEPNEILMTNDGWMICSSNKGEYNIKFVNLMTDEGFYAIRKGRGPGEMIDGGDLHRFDDDVLYYDMMSAVCVRIDIAESIMKHSAVLDTVAVFEGKSGAPVYMNGCDGGFVSGVSSDDDFWYALYDVDGNICSCVNPLSYNVLQTNKSLKTSVMLSSKYATNRNGSKVCVANVASPSLSFSEIKDGVMNEFKRYEICAPMVSNGRLLASNRTAFSDAVADDSYVYLLYSGNMIIGDTLPSNECNHLIVYDWNGCPVRHYELGVNICNLSVVGNCIWGLSTFPDFKIFKFWI